MHTHSFNKRNEHLVSEVVLARGCAAGDSIQLVEAMGLFYSPTTKNP